MSTQKACAEEALLSAVAWRIAMVHACRRSWTAQRSMSRSAARLTGKAGARTRRDGRIGQ
jgi:hypothetical protein